jgi:hypothetical protein
MAPGLVPRASPGAFLFGPFRAEGAKARAQVNLQMPQTRSNPPFHHPRASERRRSHSLIGTIAGSNGTRRPPATVATHNRRVLATILPPQMIALINGVPCLFC